MVHLPNLTKHGDLFLHMLRGWYLLLYWSKSFNLMFLTTLMYLWQVWNVIYSFFFLYHVHSVFDYLLFGNQCVRFVFFF